MRAAQSTAPPPSAPWSCAHPSPLANSPPPSPPLLPCPRLASRPPAQALSPRQIQTIAASSFLGAIPKRIEPGMRGSVISEVPLEYLVKKLGGASLIEDGR